MEPILLLVYNRFKFSFPSPRLVVPRLKIPVCSIFTHCLRGNIWILMQCEIQTASFRNWIWLTKSTSSDNNNYVTNIFTWLDDKKIQFQGCSLESSFIVQSQSVLSFTNSWKWTICIHAFSKGISTMLRPEISKSQVNIFWMCILLKGCCRICQSKCRFFFFISSTLILFILS